MSGAFDAGTVNARLILDLKEWTANIEKAKADTSSLAGTVNKHKEDIEKFGKAFAVVGAAITGALGMALKSATNYTLEIGRMSVKTGIATETLSGLREAAEKSGMSLDELGVGMRRFASISVDAMNGNEAAQKTMKQLGISATDASGKIKPMDQLLLETADKFKNMKDGSEKAALAVDIFGRSGTMMIPFLNKGAEGIREFVAEQKEMGTLITNEGVASAKAFKYSMMDLEHAFMGVQLAIGNALMPVVKGIANAFSFVIVNARKVYEIFPPLGNTITIVVGALGALMAVVGSGIFVWTKMTSLFIQFSAMLPVLNARLATTGLSMGKLALAAGVLTLAYEATTWACKRWQESLDRDLGKVMESANKTGKGWNFIQDSFKGLTSVSKTEMQKIIEDQKRLGQNSEQIGETVYTMFRLKISAGMKAAAKDSMEMADKIKDVAKELDDKLKNATLDEFNYRRYQAKVYYDDIIAKSKGSVDEAKIAAQAKKVLEAELTKIAKDEGEKQAENRKQVNEKLLGHYFWLMDGMKQIGNAGTNYLKDAFGKFDTFLMANLDKEGMKFGVFADKWIAEWSKGAKKGESAFQKSMKKIDGYLQIVQQGFGQFFQAMQQKSDAYYQAQFAKLDRLYSKQKEALSKEYNDKIAMLNAKDAAESYSKQRSQILLSNMSEAEKQAALQDLETERKKTEERAALEKEYADKQAALEAEQTKKRKDLEYQQAVANKKSAIVQAVINMATAITASWKLGFPLGIFAAAFAGAACLFQIDAIKKQPLPQMAEGGLVTRPTQVLAGEAGPEAILPMRELKRMLGVKMRGGAAGSRTVTINIQTIDAEGLKPFVKRAIIPQLKKALSNESMTISPNAVRY